ncbi:Adenine nucleotide alpha hydrolases-like superfamily protein, putative isoform 1 [Hibiscus syriacus]|uniref:Adenine nucleotide alpha hydrolases-like superfamily protein, putative isoform 1 n=1 Tax=Hibiscus syriacus TaxID=106335 RepID=A0A6A2X8C4_HIBSY|nr:Adenine nucleotide alpha hydrolases-like superfamily protein, putative isoform 1 [Hibiscus syriacus]
MSRIWKWYERCLSIHPVKTQVVSSGVLWEIGDVGAQYITYSTAKKRLRCRDAEQECKIDWKRAAATSLFGFGFTSWTLLEQEKYAPWCLQPLFPFVRSVAMDRILFSPFDLFLFFSYMGLSTGKSVPQVKEEVKRDFLPALILEGGIWPIVQIVNFRYIPVKYQLLCVNIFCLLDCAFLSWIEHQNNAPWKSRFGGSQGRW